MGESKGQLTVIIPIHNIYNRGQLRVYNSCYSLLKQKDLANIIIVDSSTPMEVTMLSGLLKQLNTEKITHLSVQSNVFNKSKLLNEGIALAQTEYVMCTDADYIFKPNFLDVCANVRSEKRILFKEVGMLPKIRVKKVLIDKWQFPRAPFNEWGHLANGACQYTTKQFFIDNPYPEEMEGFGAMDNIMAYMAYNNGLEIHWVKQSEILHQSHPIMKYRNREDHKRSKNNQKILAQYIKDNNLPKFLKKTR